MPHLMDEDEDDKTDGGRDAKLPGGGIDPHADGHGDEQQGDLALDEEEQRDFEF